MELKPEEIVIKVDNSFRDFVGQFGQDVYSEILIDVLLEELYGIVPLLGETRQERNQDDIGIKREMPSYSID